MEALRRTTLFELHRRLGARMTAFGGFEMPVSYAGIIDEHLAVRSRAGIFDLGHMGEFELTGDGGAGAARARDDQLGGAAGSRSGAIHTDVHARGRHDRRPDRLPARRRALTCCASTPPTSRSMCDWLLELGANDAGFRDLSDETGLVAVQGPQALAILQPLRRTPLAEMRRFAVLEAEVAGVRCVVARTGYTGEDGFELFTAAAARRDALQRDPRSRRAGRDDALRTGRARHASDGSGAAALWPRA